MGSLTAPRNPYKQSWVLVINIIGHKMIRTHLQTRFRLQNKPFCIVIGMKYSKSIATKLLYQRKPIDTAIYKKVITIKLNTLKDFKQRSRLYNAVFPWTPTTAL